MSPYIKLVLQELQATTRNVRRYGTTGVRITPFEKSTWGMHTTGVVRITRVAKSPNFILTIDGTNLIYSILSVGCQTGKIYF